MVVPPGKARRAIPSTPGSRSASESGTKDHAERVKTCLESHGQPPSKVKEVATISAGALKAPLDTARSEKGMRNARDGFATEHLEIAPYRLIEEPAKKVGDQQSMAVARQNAEDEERMAAQIAATVRNVREG